MSRALAARVLLGLLSTVLAVVPAAAATAGPELREFGTLDADERAAVAAGKPWTATLESGELEGAMAYFTLPAPVTQVYEMLLDYPTYADFMEGMKEVTLVTWTSPTTALVGVVIPSPLRDVAYVMQRDHWPYEKITWIRVSGDLEQVIGAYELFPYEGGRTLMRYHAFVDIGTWVPAFIKRFFTTKGLEGLVADLQREVARRYGAAPQLRQGAARTAGSVETDVQ